MARISFLNDKYVYVVCLAVYVKMKSQPDLVHDPSCNAIGELLVARRLTMIEDVYLKMESSYDIPPLMIRVISNTFYDKNLC